MNIVDQTDSPETLTVLAKVPTLAEIFGLVEGQIVLRKESHESVQRAIITHVYDDYIVVSDGRRQEHIALSSIEGRINNGFFAPLRKDGKPVKGSKKFLFFGRWVF